MGVWLKFEPQAVSSVVLEAFNGPYGSFRFLRASQRRDPSSKVEVIRECGFRSNDDQAEKG